MADMQPNNQTEDPIFKEANNKNYNADINSAIRYSRWVLKCIGVWPMVINNPSKTSRFLSPVFILSCNSIMAFIIVPPAIRLTMLWSGMDPMVRLMTVGPMCSCSASWLKYILMMLSHQPIKVCINHMETDWKEIESTTERAIMLKNAKIGSGLSLTCGSLLTAGGIFYHLVMPVMKGTSINEFNETIRPLIYGGYDIFTDPQKSPTYEVIFFILFISGFVRYGVTFAECSLAAVFVTHACGQIQIVISRLENLFDGMDEITNDDKLQQRIAAAIKCHVRGLRLAAKIDEALRKVCLIEASVDSLIICLLEYYLADGAMTMWNDGEIVAIITYVILLFSYTFNIFILCHIGELLKQQYHEVGTASYMIEWYRLPGKMGLALVLIIAMGHIPRKITGGQMIDLSVASFGAIMKSSFVYLNMLRTFAD